MGTRGSRFTECNIKCILNNNFRREWKSTQIWIWCGFGTSANCVPMFAVRAGLCGWKHRHHFTPKCGPKSCWHKLNLLELEIYHTGTATKDWLALIKDGIVLAFLPPTALCMNKNRAAQFICRHSGMLPHTHAHYVSVSLPICSWKMLKYVNVKMFLLPNQCNHIWNSASACLWYYSTSNGGDLTSLSSTTFGLSEKISQAFPSWDVV